MIQYSNTGFNFLWNIFKLEGSVFPKAIAMSVPNTIFTTTLVYLVHDLKIEALQVFSAEKSVMSNNSIWGGFCFVVSFLVVFRTSQAYARFWEGCSSMHKMGAEWFDACSALIAFTRFSKLPKPQIQRFQNVLVRLVSMLHAAALGEIEECGGTEADLHVEAFGFEIIDAEAISEDVLIAIRDSDSKVELIFQMIQQTIVENITTGVLCIPPPILSRSFQEIANGMVHFHDALKISNVPFPFPYAQTCDVLLMLHYFLTPFVLTPWVVRCHWAAFFGFMQIFTFWVLNFIAAELENPFGSDDNDIDGAQLQKEVNSCLRLLLRTGCAPTVSLKLNNEEDQQLLIDRATLGAKCIRTSFDNVWESIEPGVPVARRALRRKNFQTSRTSIVPNVADEVAATKQTKAKDGRTLLPADAAVSADKSREVVCPPMALSVVASPAQPVAMPSVTAPAETVADPRPSPSQASLAPRSGASEGHDPADAGVTVNSAQAAANPGGLKPSLEHSVDVGGMGNGECIGYRTGLGGGCNSQLAVQQRLFEIFEQIDDDALPIVTAAGQRRDRSCRKSNGAEKAANPGGLKPSLEHSVDVGGVANGECIGYRTGLGGGCNSQLAVQQRLFEIFEQIDDDAMPIATAAGQRRDRSCRKSNGAEKATKAACGA
eukprot:TRINITY_DN20114_c0_g2_i1.p1 TRINITY_DN20114_c0_g2~~TRINITY_DN20114_c0_g2_i1.p1  ORF type:complete len:658 (+),score=121.31 TRINITY_DN20114_c0_g2_i1:128-2101(+)